MYLTPMTYNWFSISNLIKKLVSKKKTYKESVGPSPLTYFIWYRYCIIWVGVRILNTSLVYLKNSEFITTKLLNKKKYILLVPFLYTQKNGWSLTCFFWFGLRSYLLTTILRSKFILIYNIRKTSKHKLYFESLKK